MKQKTKKEGYGRKKGNKKNITINQGGGRYRTFYNIINFVSLGVLLLYALYFYK